jgi:hypothetical protein
MAVFMLIVLPILSFLSGILGLQSDPKTEKRKKAIVIVVLALSALGSVIVSLQQQQSDATDKSEMKETLSAQKTSLKFIQDSVDEMKGVLLGILGKNGGAPQQIEALSKATVLGPAALKIVQQSVNADDALKSITPAVTAENQSHATTVIYYPKDVDPSNVNGEVLKGVLTAAGFNVQQAQGGERNPDLPTNAVWAGENIPIDKVKFVTLSLMRAGLQIRAIRSFRSDVNGIARKPDIIELGADARVQSSPPKTIEQVLALTTLPRR